VFLSARKGAETTQPKRCCYGDATMRSTISASKDDEMVRCLIPSLLDRCQVGVFELWVPGRTAACGCEVEDRP
jgi:hypothetical protein